MVITTENLPELFHHVSFLEPCIWSCSSAKVHLIIFGEIVRGT